MKAFRNEAHTILLRKNMIGTCILSSSLHVGFFILFFLWKPYGYSKVNPYTPRAIRGYLVEDASFFKPKEGIEKPKDSLPPPKITVTKPIPKEEKVVALPVQKPKEKQEPKKKEEPKKEVKKETRVEVEPEAIEKLKELQELFTPGEENTRVPRKENFSAGDSGKGGRGIPGGETEGVVPNSELEFLLAEYSHNLKTYIISRWLVTNMKALRANPKAIAYVYVKIDRKGNLLDLLLKKTSGIRSFDEDCLNTIRQAEPLLEPPEKLIPIIVGNELQLEFVAEGVLKAMGAEE